MHYQRDPYRPTPSRPQSPIESPGGRGLPLAGLIRRKLYTVALRDQQRSQLLNVLIVAQALLTLAIAVGYVGTAATLSSFLPGGLALLVYVAALASNRMLHRSTTAAYLLVIGGSLAVGLQALLPALAGNATQAAQAALLFSSIILEAGLLFWPEVTLIVATATTAFTAFAILLALALQPNLDRHQAYLLMVYTVGVQALASLISWLVAQFIWDSALEAQRAEDLQFAHVRLEAREAQMDERKQAFEESVRAVQSTITRVLGGEYNARVEVADGDLIPMADSLNLLLERVATAMQAEQMRARLEAAALPMIDSVARMADSGTPPPSSLPTIITNTPLDSLSVALSQMQVAMTQRLVRLQRLATDMVGALGHSQEVLTSTSESAQEAQRIAGALISNANAVLDTTRHAVATLARAQRLLAGILPEEITHRAPQGELPREGSGLDGPDGGLLGLGPDLGIANPGYTGEFPVLSDDGDLDGHDIPPLTRPLPVVDLAAAQEQAAAPTQEPRPATFTGELPAEVVDVWNALVQLNGDAAQMERSLSQLVRELGVQSRHVRTADANIAWFRQALDAVRTNAEQLQQAAGANLPPPGPSDSGGNTPSRPLGPRVPQRTRPLADMTDDGTLRELASLGGTPAPVGEEPPAPGSLRLADLLALDEGGDPLHGAPVDAPRPVIDEAGQA
jgi:hypothetical protein